eukprot:2336837-Pleurochrysis_carterae.AAC.3
MVVPPALASPARATSLATEDQPARYRARRPARLKAFFKRQGSARPFSRTRHALRNPMHGPRFIQWSTQIVATAVHLRLHHVTLCALCTNFCPTPCANTCICSSVRTSPMFLRSGNCCSVILLVTSLAVAYRPQGLVSDCNDSCKRQQKAIATSEPTRRRINSHCATLYNPPGWLTCGNKWSHCTSDIEHQIDMSRSFLF